MEQSTIDKIDVEQLTVEAIQDVACLVALTQHKWDPTVTDEEVTREVKQAKKAHGDAGKWRKNLLNGSKAGMSKVTTAMSKAYRSHVTLTLPFHAFGNTNQRLISNSMLLEYMKTMNVHQTALKEAAAEWAQTLPNEIANAIRLNGDMGRADEYPTPDEIINSFRFEFVFSPVPDSSGFSALPDGFRERFSEIYEDRARACAIGAQDAGVQRLISAVASFADVLRKEKPRIYESTLDQLKMLHSVASAFNITGDDKLRESLDRIQADFLCYSKDQLAGNVDNQRKALEAADDILRMVGMSPAVESPASGGASERSEGQFNDEPAPAGDDGPLPSNTSPTDTGDGGDDDDMTVDEFMDLFHASDDSDDDPELTAALTRSF